MRLMEMEPSAFLIREKRCNAQLFGIATTCCFCRSHLRAQMERSFIAFCPATDAHHKAIGFLRHAHIRSLDQGPRLDTGGYGLATEGLPVPPHRHVAPRTDHRGPMILLHRRLERGASER